MDTKAHIFWYRGDVPSLRTFLSNL